MEKRVKLSENVSFRKGMSQLRFELPHN